MKLTFETKAWLPRTSDLKITDINTPEGTRALFMSSNDMSTHGWTLVGTATVALELDQAEMRDARILALKSSAEKISAEANHAIEAITNEIQELMSPAGEVLQ